MIAVVQNIPLAILLFVATLLEAGGDALVRMGLFNYTGPLRFGIYALGAAALVAYGTVINLAPVDFGRVVGAYVALLFVTWQVITFVAFRSVPTTPIILGGALIVAGGLISTFWKVA